MSDSPADFAAPAAEPVADPAAFVRVFHFADVHLGVETYGKYNPETGLNTRLEDFTEALNAAITQALENGADLAVFAGDAYKARDPNQTHQRAFAGSLKRLTAAGVPVVMLVGNHDIPNTRGKAHALEIYGLLGGAGVTILSAPEVATVRTRRGAVLVAGMPYLTRSRVLAKEEVRDKTVEEVAHHIRDAYARYIAELAARVAERPEHIAILTGHFTVANARVGVQGFLLNPAEPQVPAQFVSLEQFDYVAMGHVHKYQQMNPGQQPPIVYCGSVDRIDFGERAEDKGFVIADVQKRHADPKHIRLDTRKFLELSIDCGDADDPTRVILDEINRHLILGAVVKLSYKVPPDKAALIRTDEIRKALGAAHLTVALSRELPPAEARVRAQLLSEAVTPEKALATYLELQPRLAPRKDELLDAARPLLDALEHEETLR